MVLNSDENLLLMLSLDFRIFLDKTKVLIRTVEELREKTWELDTSTRSKDQKLKKGNIASQNLNTRYILWQKVKISQQIMSQSHKEVIVQNMEGKCLGTLGISQSLSPIGFLWIFKLLISAFHGPLAE